MTVGVLIIHGFSGGPYEVLPFTQYVEEKTDWLVHTPTLCGHGEALSLRGYKALHWLKDAENAYMQLAKKVDEVMVVGFSMGGLIAIYLAKRYKVKKLVLLSAAAKYVSPKQLLKDIKMMATDAYRRNLDGNELFKGYQKKFKEVPLAATVEFMKIVKIITPYLKSIQTPVYIVQGKLDGVVPYHTAQYLFDLLSASEKHLYFSPNGKHHVCFADDCSDWFMKVLKFLKQ